MPSTPRWRAEQRPAAVVVIPLLFETGAGKDLDVTVCVACSPQTQRQRLMDRGWTGDQIEQRINAQWPIERKISNADFVIWTESGPEIMEKQVDRIFGVPVPTAKSSP